MEGLASVELAMHEMQQIQQRRIYCLYFVGAKIAHHEIDFSQTVLHVLTVGPVDRVRSFTSMEIVEAQVPLTSIGFLGVIQKTSDLSQSRTRPDGRCGNCAELQEMSAADPAFRKVRVLRELLVLPPPARSLPQDV